MRRRLPLRRFISLQCRPLWRGDGDKRARLLDQRFGVVEAVALGNEIGGGQCGGATDARFAVDVDLAARCDLRLDEIDAFLKVRRAGRVVVDGGEIAVVREGQPVGGVVVFGAQVDDGGDARAFERTFAGGVELRADVQLRRHPAEAEHRHARHVGKPASPPPLQRHPQPLLAQPPRQNLSAFAQRRHRLHANSFRSQRKASITTGAPQTLYVDGKDAHLVRNKNVVLVDDVISTGSTLRGLHQLMGLANATVVGEMAVFTEGKPEEWNGVIALGHLPVFTD